MNASAKDATRRGRLGRQAVLLAIATLLLAAIGTLTACGSSDSSSTTSSASAATATSDSAGGSTEPTATDSVVADAQAAAEKGFAGNIAPVPTSGPTAQKGKNVWVISCGEAYYGCHLASSEIKNAGQELDWDVNIADGKASPQVASGLVRQAIAAKADGIVTLAFDCPAIKSALTAAQTAKIPVVNAYGLDCSDPSFDSQKPLFTVTSYPELVSYWQGWGRDRARYVIEKTNGKATVLDVHPTDSQIHKYQDEAFRDELSKCAQCKVIDVPFSLSQVPNPFLQIVRSAILAHPEANVLANAQDSLLDIGFKSVLEAAKAKNPDLIVVGGDGSPAAVDAIKAGQQDISLFQTNAYNSWAVADSLNRVFAGEDPKAIAALKGGGWQWVDKDHIAAVEQLPFKGSVDYEAGYNKLWNGSGS